MDKLPGGKIGRITAKGLITAIGIYSLLVLSLISVLTLASDAGPDQKAIIKMALGLNLIWVVLGGFLMVRFRDPIRELLLGIPLPWWVKFPLFCTALALLEEGVTVSMTNLAPLFGSEVGRAFITASANYLHTVLFHSVIVFIPMFLIWTLLLRYFDFPPTHVFLLFGLTGSIAEMSMSSTNILGGFWFFVYGLMVYLPAYSLPRERPARQPKWWAYLLAVAGPLISPILLLPVTPLLRYLWERIDPTFFVDSAWD
jgi:uncharacterized membrane protein YhaH (DUF805 family)